MENYVKPRILPKLQSRTDSQSGCNRHDGVTVDFRDACVYLEAWLGDKHVSGIAQFPFARLYPVKGGLYNLSIRRLIDWSLVEDNPIWAIQDMFWNQAPNAKFWVTVANHRTFEECIELLRVDPNF